MWYVITMDRLYSNFYGMIMVAKVWGWDGKGMNARKQNMSKVNIGVNKSQ